MINPYTNVNWNSAIKIQSLSHSHSHSQGANRAFESIQSWYEDGIRHFPYSNYYPSHPSYPILDDPYWSRGVQEDYTLLREWIADNNIDDIIEGPNAEHHTIQDDSENTMSRLHMNGLGSFYSSGNPPDIEPVGARIPWKKVVDNVVENLQYPDAGGVTINHPTWTNQAVSHPLTDDVVFNMLDYDSRVLGIEIYCHPDFDLELFDRILKTGRRCWGFCSPDHAFPGYKSDLGSAGRNVLLIPSDTPKSELEHACLKAYRDGRFFGKLNGKHPTISNSPGLIFTNIDFNVLTNKITVETLYADEIKCITDKGVQTVANQTAVFNIPRDAVYARVQASGLNDMIFSNPIIFKPFVENSSHTVDFIQLFMD